MNEMKTLTMGGKTYNSFQDSTARAVIEELMQGEKPLVYIDGEIPTTKNNVLATMTVKSNWLNIFAYIKIKCQGSSSMSYPKKNFTVTLYQDEARTIPMKITTPGWKHASNKFVLKANWIDHTHARNIVTANLWSEVVASRSDYDALPEELRNSPNNGAIDGFPIIVTANGTYQGIYTWNIGKDDWMWGMDEDNPNHVLMCAETNTNGAYRETPCNFRKLWDGTHEKDWSVEVGTNSEAVKNSLNALISCVKDTDDATFKSTIGRYLDVQSAIDYCLLTCADCGIDSNGRNLLLGTYDLQKWYCGKYDLDSTWLLWWDGYKFISPETEYPTDYQECFSLLWSRTITVFWEELYNRGLELRKTVLSYANVLSHFENFCASIGTETYSDDLAVYGGIPSSSNNNIWQLRNAVRNRLTYFDGWLEALQEGVACESVSVDIGSELTMTRGERITFTAKIQPTSTTEKVIWSSSDDTIVKVDRKTGQAEALKIGSVVVSAVCGKQVSTCSITVNGNGDDLMYRLRTATTLDGTRQACIDTGVKLVDVDKDFTIAVDVTPEMRSGVNTPRYVFCNNNTTYGSPNAGIRLASMCWPYVYGVTTTEHDDADGDGVDTEILTIAKDDTGERSTIVIRHEKGSNTLTVTSCYQDKTETVTGKISSSVFTDSNANNLWIGGLNPHSEDAATYFFVGTVNRFDIYNRYISDDEVTAFISGMTD
jgi:hypothetical protein